MPAYKYYLKNGKTKWYANFYYSDWKGEKQHKCKRGFDRERDAKEYERMFLDKYSKSPTILYSSLVENYLDDMATRLKITTIKNKRSLFETKVFPFFGKTKTCDIDAEMIRKWQNEMILYRDENGKPYSETYLKAINNQLSASLNYAVNYYKLPSNPCHAAGSMGKTNAEEMNIWTHEQFLHFIECVPKQAYSLCFKTLFYSGGREGEILALTPEDIPRDNALIDINKNYAVVDGMEFFLTPKTARSIRQTTIPDTLHKELLDYIDLLDIQPEERIFYFRKGGLTKEFANAMKRSGNSKIRVHDLRHSHVSMLIHMGIQIEEISRRIGHDSVKTTWDTYSHLYPGSDKKLANKIDRVIIQESTIKKESQKEILNSAKAAIVPGSPLSAASQSLLYNTEKEANEHIQKNNRNIFSKYGIDIDNEILFGYPLSSYLDFIAFGDSVIQILSSFRPDEKLKNFILTLFSESVSSCELSNGSILDLDKYICEITIPKYQEMYGISV